MNNSGRGEIVAMSESGCDVSAKRINNVLGPLRGLFEEALEDGLIEVNPLKLAALQPTFAESET